MARVRNTSSQDALLLNCFFNHPNVNSTLANANFYAQCAGLDRIPRYYHAVLRRTKSFVTFVSQLTRFSNAAALVIDFSIILLTDNPLFELMLNGQRAHIYWLLDEALLRLCLDEWERPICTHPQGAVVEQAWPQTVEPFIARLSTALETGLCPEEGICLVAPVETSRITRNPSNWCDIFQYREAPYFKRSREFLAESVAVFQVRRTVNACLQGRLPQELADHIIDDVLASMRMPTGRLRRKYFPKGKNGQTKVD